MTVNYEALGRYVASEEAIKELLLKQTQLAHQIDRLLTKTKNDYPATKAIQVIQTALLVDLSTELSHVHFNLIVAIHRINSYADDAKKPKIDLIS